jgi:PAS domain S-box-containing protein
MKKHPQTSAHGDPISPSRIRNEWSGFTGISDDLQEPERRLRTVIDTIPGLVWSALPDGSVEFCNQQWLDYTGMSFDEVKGWGWTAAIHPRDIFGFEAKWRGALVQGTPCEAEARMRKADGCYRWFLMRAVPLRSESGGIRCWYGTNTDVEDLKRSEQEVQKQTALLGELFEQAPGAVAVLNPDDCVVRVNNEFKRMFGYQSE